MDYTYTDILPEATLETMSELNLIQALLPLQLGMAICYHYESAYFPVAYTDNQLLSSLCDPKRQASNTTIRFSSRLSNIHNFTRNDIQNFPGWACPSRRPIDLLRYIVYY